MIHHIPSLPPSPFQNCARAPRPAPRRAFTLIEAMAMIVILSIVGVGVATGLHSAFLVPRASDRVAAISTELRSESENWRALAFGGSPWPAILPYSSTDTVAIKIGGQNTTFSRTTNIQKWDPNNLATNASPQADFVRVQITINAVTYVTYLTNPS